MRHVSEPAPASAERLTPQRGKSTAPQNVLCREQHPHCGAVEGKAGIAGGHRGSTTRSLGNPHRSEIQRAADPVHWRGPLGPPAWIGIRETDEGPAFRVLYAPNGLDDAERATLEQVLLDLMQETTAGSPTGDPAG